MVFCGPTLPRVQSRLGGCSPKDEKKKKTDCVTLKLRELNGYNTTVKTNSQNNKQRY